MARDRSLLRLEKLRTQRSRADGDMLKHRLSKFKSIFSSVATSGKLSKENFLLYLKECDLDIMIKLHRKTYIRNC